MGSSASDRRSEAPESFAFFRISGFRYDSYYGIYNSTGQLIKGEKHLEQYTELATFIDTKRSAFYLESKENEIIFGCSLSVKADNGREERVVFIQVYKNLPRQVKIDPNITLLKQFYERVKFEVENLDVKKYGLVGFWENGDFKNINDVSIDKEILKYTAGKICYRKKVSIKISELSSGFSLILRLVTILRRMNTSFILDVSQYPSESDVSVSLIKPNPDFEIEENGKSQELTKAELWNFYKELGEDFIKDITPYSKGSQIRSDSVNPVVMKILSNPFYYCSSSNSVLDNLDDKDKVEILQDLVQKITDVNDSDIRKVLINIYRKIRSPECRKNIHKILLSRNIYIEELLTDLVITIHQEHNKDLFNLLFNSTSRDNLPLGYVGNEWVQNPRRDSKYDAFQKGIKKAIKQLEDSDKVNFVKFIAGESPSRPKAEGRILLGTLVEYLVSQNRDKFILKLSEEEAENLDLIQGSNYLDSKKRLKKRNRNKFIKRGFYACSFLLIVILMAYFFIYHIHPIESEGVNNSSLNYMENSSGLDKSKGWSDNKTENISKANILLKNDQKMMKNNTTNETN